MKLRTGEVLVVSPVITLIVLCRSSGYISEKGLSFCSGSDKEKKRRCCISGHRLLWIGLLLISVIYFVFYAPFLSCLYPPHPPAPAAFPSAFKYRSTQTLNDWWSKHIGPAAGFLLLRWLLLCHFPDRIDWTLFFFFFFFAVAELGLSSPPPPDRLATPPSLSRSGSDSLWQGSSILILT